MQELVILPQSLEKATCEPAILFVSIGQFSWEEHGKLWVAIRTARMCVRRVALHARTYMRAPVYEEA